MDEMAHILLDGKSPIIPVDGNEAVKDLKVLDAVYEACRTGSKQTLSL